MSLRSDDLNELTKRINARLDEFKASLWLTRGAVRVAHEVIEEWQREQDEEVVEDYANARAAAYEQGYLAAMNAVREDAAKANAFLLKAAANGYIVEQVPWQAEATPTVAGMAAEDDDPADLAADWPDMPDLPDGVDLFAEHPVAGEPEQTPLLDRPIGRDRTASLSHPWKGRVDGKPSNPLPHPDVARERLAQALAKGSGGNLVQAINMPRTLAEADDDDDLFDDDDEDGDEVEERQFKTSPEERQRAKEYRQRTHHTRRTRHNENGEAKGHSGKILPSREQVIAELQRQAMAGVMPTRAQFDIARPANWATAQAHVARLGMSWGELCDAAGLKPNPRLAAAMEA